MALQYDGFFNYIPYDDAPWNAQWDAAITSGVKQGGDNLRVVVDPDIDMVIDVLPGVAWINGRFFSMQARPQYDPGYEGDESPNYTRLYIRNGSSKGRTDRIILRMNNDPEDVERRYIRLMVLEGTEASPTLPPALVRTGSTYDLSLARITIPANSSEMSKATITDERFDADVCGIATSKMDVDLAPLIEDIYQRMERVNKDWVAQTVKIENDTNTEIDKIRLALNGINGEWRSQSKTIDEGAVLQRVDMRAEFDAFLQALPTDMPGYERAIADLQRFMGTANNDITRLRIEVKAIQDLLSMNIIGGQTAEVTFENLDGIVIEGYHGIYDPVQQRVYAGGA